MIMGPRPTLGWLGYLVLGRSWRSVAVVLAFMMVLASVVMREAKHTLTLIYSPPLPFPPPLEIVPPPSLGHMTPLDACSVEAAAVKADHVGGRSEGGDHGHLDTGEGVGVKGHVGREVYAYGWSGNVRPRDVWAQWVANLPRSHLGRVVLKQIADDTPIHRLKYLGGEEWRMWAAGRVGLLWVAGGVSVPLGVVATRAMWVEALGEGSGMLVMDKQGHLDPVMLATPAHHPLLETLAYGLTEDYNVKNLTELLTNAVKEECGLTKMSDLPSSDCSDFSLLPPSAVVDFDINKIPDEKQVQSAALLRYTGPHDDLLDLLAARGLFRRLHLKRYCPLTADYLTELINAS